MSIKIFNILKIPMLAFFCSVALTCIHLKETFIVFPVSWS